MQAESDDKNYAIPRAGVSEEDLLAEMRGRYKACSDYWEPKFALAAKDMRFAFVPDEQWDEWMRSSRSADRPMYTVNKLRQALKQITNDQRMNRPQPKVRAVEDGDKDLADLRQGLFRNIEQQSNADRAYDTAFEFAVGGGYGVWRITTQYADEGSFDQDIRLKEVSNPYSVKFDPAAREKDRRDARFAFVDQLMPRAEYKARFPEAEIKDFAAGISKDQTLWWTDKAVRVAEYWYKVAEISTICQLSDGRIVEKSALTDILDDLAANGITILKERQVELDRVKHCLVSGSQILEGPTDWPGKFIPIVVVWGNLLNIEGEELFCGETAFNKDAQRMYNYERTTFIEYIAEQPYSPLMADAKSIEGYEKQYEGMRTARPPVLLYNADPSLPNGGKPTREQPPAFPAALAQAAQISADDIKSGTGKFDASLGARSNETSGRAIMARQREGDMSSFDYLDNLSFAQKYSFEIINDLVPYVLDTERQIRWIGEDGAEKVIAVNKPEWDQQTGQWVTVNDLAQGRFDIAVTVGPSFTTARMEAAENLQLISNDPSPVGMLAKIAFIEALDAPGLEWVKKGARKWAVQNGLAEPEEGEQPPPPPQPNPKDVAEAGRAAAQAANYAAQAQGQEIENSQAAFQMGVRQAMLEPSLPPSGYLPQ